MKNLDIDTDGTDFSANRSCRVMIEFAGGCLTEKIKTGATHHRVIVPYSSFSKKLQTIHQLGGKIINISLLNSAIDAVKVAPTKVEGKEVDFERVVAVIPEEIPAIALVETLMQTDAPDTDVPDTDAPDTDGSDTDAPDTDAPNTDVPDTDAPDIVKTSLDINISAHPAIDLTESTPPLPKFKKTKTSSKSGQGFNKSKGDIKPPQKPKDC